jgi:ADP-ribosylglycohydrolase
VDRRAEIEWAVALGRYTIEDLRQRGYETTELEPLQSQAENLLKTGSLDDALAQACRVRATARQTLSLRPSWPYVEPTTESEIQALLARPQGLAPYNAADYERDVLNSWLGMTAGAALGLPIENWSAERIAAEHGEIHSYLTDPPPTLNDDSSFQVISLHALEEHGPQLDSWQLGLEWVAHMTTGMTAEGVALGNLKRGLRPPQTASEDNPFAEWVGAAMRGEIWGLLAPGRPDVACRYALRDALISHQLNGVYGELFVAALLSLAFVQRDSDELIHSALLFVPPSSRLAELVGRTFLWRAQCATWRAALARYEQEYSAYARVPFHQAHVFPCLASALIALLYGEADFSQSICIAAMCGGDADFAPALVGAILGIWTGAAGIPQAWRAPLGSEFDTMVIGMERLRYDEFSWRIGQARKLLEEDQ